MKKSYRLQNARIGGNDGNLLGAASEERSQCCFLVQHYGFLMYFLRGARNKYESLALSPVGSKLLLCAEHELEPSIELCLFRFPFTG